MISFYQRFVSPLLHSLTHYLFGPFSGCRFSPTCSEYYKISLKKYGFIKGNLKGLFRILRCNPFFSGGVDNP